MSAMMLPILGGNTEIAGITGTPGGNASGGASTKPLGRAYSPSSTDNQEFPHGLGDRPRKIHQSGPVNAASGAMEEEEEKKKGEPPPSLHMPSQEPGTASELDSGPTAARLRLLTAGQPRQLSQQQQYSPPTGAPGKSSRPEGDHPRISHGQGARGFNGVNAKGGSCNGATHQVTGMLGALFHPHTTASYGGRGEGHDSFLQSPRQSPFQRPGQQVGALGKKGDPIHEKNLVARERMMAFGGARLTDDSVKKREEEEIYLQARVEMAKQLGLSGSLQEAITRRATYTSHIAAFDAGAIVSSSGYVISLAKLPYEAIDPTEDVRTLHHQYGSDEGSSDPGGSLLDGDGDDDGGSDTRSGVTALTLQPLSRPGIGGDGSMATTTKVSVARSSSKFTISYRYLLHCREAVISRHAWGAEDIQYFEAFMCLGPAGQAEYREDHPARQAFKRMVHSCVAVEFLETLRGVTAILRLHQNGDVDDVVCQAVGQWKAGRALVIDFRKDLRIRELVYQGHLMAGLDNLFFTLQVIHGSSVAGPAYAHLSVDTAFYPNLSPEQIQTRFLDEYDLADVEAAIISLNTRITDKIRESNQVSHNHTQQMRAVKAYLR